MAIEKKTVTKKPSWMGGILVPILIGALLGWAIIATLKIDGTSLVSSATWYIMAAWQLICGLAVIFERAPVYGATSIPQARRLAELYGLSWLGMSALTVLSSHEMPSQSSLPTIVLCINLVGTFAFSIAAGPTRLVNANDNEMYLIPTNSFLVGWASAILLCSSTSF